MRGYFLLFNLNTTEFNIKPYEIIPLINIHKKSLFSV